MRNKRRRSFKSARYLSLLCLLSGVLSHCVARAYSPPPPAQPLPLSTLQDHDDTAQHRDVSLYNPAEPSRSTSPIATRGGGGARRDEAYRIERKPWPPTITSTTTTSSNAIASRPVRQQQIQQPPMLRRAFTTDVSRYRHERAPVRERATTTTTAGPGTGAAIGRRPNYIRMPDNEARQTEQRRPRPSFKGISPFFKFEKEDTQNRRKKIRDVWR